MDDACWKVIAVLVAIVIVLICLPLILQGNAPYYQAQVNAVIPGFDLGTTLAVFGGILAFSYLYYRKRAGQ